MTAHARLVTRRHVMADMAKAMSIRQIADELRIDYQSVRRDLIAMGVKAQKRPAKYIGGFRGLNLSKVERADYNTLQRHGGMLAAEALQSIGRADLITPALPALNDSGAYDKADLQRYLRQAVAAGMQASGIAALLKVPPHRVTYFLSRLSYPR